MANRLTNVRESVTPQAEARGAGRGRNYALLAFLYGAARREELSGVTVTRLLGDFGIGESAVRALLARMRKAGDLEGTRRGRTVYYRMAGTYAAAFDRMAAGSAGGGATWDGTFHALLYQVPEGSRPFRDALRRSALLTGYGQLQPGVLIALSDRTDRLADVLARRPPEAHIRTARLTFDAPAAAEAASAAWGLPELEMAYRGHLETLRAALSGSEELPAEAATLVRMTELAMPPMADILSDPSLPAELRPEGWPLPDLWQAIGQIFERYGPPAGTYIERVIAGEV